MANSFSFSPPSSWCNFIHTQTDRRGLPCCLVQSIVHFKALLVHAIVPGQRHLLRLVPILTISMASTVFFYFSCGANNDVVGWIAGALVFALGVFYIVIHFWALKDDQFAATISMDRSARWYTTQMIKSSSKQTLSTRFFSECAPSLAPSAIL